MPMIMPNVSRSRLSWMNSLTMMPTQRDQEKLIPGLRAALLRHAGLERFALHGAHRPAAAAFRERELVELRLVLDIGGVVVPGARLDQVRIRVAQAAAVEPAAGGELRPEE